MKDLEGGVVALLWLKGLDPPPKDLTLYPTTRESSGSSIERLCMMCESMVHR